MGECSFAGRFKVGTRIYTGFLFILALLGVVAVIGVRGFDSVDTFMGRYSTISDNAERVARLGISRTIPRHRYTPARVATELQHLFDDPAYARRASEIGEQVRQEDGVRVACDALGRMLQAAGSMQRGMAERTSR